MHWNFALFMSGVILLAFRSVLEANADECIDFEQYSQAVHRCCRVENFVTDEVAKKCYQELAEKITPNTQDFVTCYIECIYREMGYLTESNEMVVEKYSEFLAGYDELYRKTASYAFTSCSKIQQDIQRDVANTNTRCSAFAMLFHVCVSQMTLKNCPNDRWTYSEICSKLRAGVQPCD